MNLKTRLQVLESRQRAPAFTHMTEADLAEAIADLSGHLAAFPDERLDLREAADAGFLEIANRWGLSLA